MTIVQADGTVTYRDDVAEARAEAAITGVLKCSRCSTEVGPGGSEAYVLCDSCYRDMGE